MEAARAIPVSTRSGGSGKARQRRRTLYFSRLAYSPVSGDRKSGLGAKKVVLSTPHTFRPHRTATHIPAEVLMPAPA